MNSKKPKSEKPNFENYEYLDSFEGLAQPDQKPINRFSKLYAKAIFPGLVCSLMIALSAMFLSRHYAAPAVFFALLFGLAVNFLATLETTKLGFQFAAKDLLRIGIAISGAQITFQEVSELGLSIVAAVMAIVGLTFFSGIIFARLLKLPKEIGILAGGAVAICGASAALAVSSVLPNSKNLERNTIFIIVCVATFSTIAMITYPIISNMLGHTHTQAGLFFGATIHDVAQVLGAGYAVSETSGEVATVTKLLRVALLFPIVSMITIFVGSGIKSGNRSVPTIPGFLVVFIIIVALNSFGIIPPVVADTLSQAARICLVLAVGALGVQTSFASLQSVGWRPILMVFMQTVLMACLMIGFLHFS